MVWTIYGKPLTDILEIIRFLLHREKEIEKEGFKMEDSSDPLLIVSLSKESTGLIKKSYMNIMDSVE